MSKLICWKCGVSDDRLLYDDPCCAAPDCEHTEDVVHYECASDYVKREIRDLYEKEW